MARLFFALIGAAMLALTIPASAQVGVDVGPGGVGVHLGGRPYYRDYDRDRDHGHGYDHGRHEGYRDHDHDIRGWYQAHYRHLPPGLAKRDRLSPVQERYLVVQGVLPVSLRTHMQPCPHELEVMLPPPPPNHIHVFIGGNLVLVNRSNYQIADVFHFEIN